MTVYEKRLAMHSSWVQLEVELFFPHFYHSTVNSVHEQCIA